MKKVIQIALHEYKQRVARKSFIVVLLMPLIFIAVIIVVGFISASATINSDRGVVGYVDPANALATAVPPPADADNTFQRFDSVEAARAALENEAIIAYYVLAPGFDTTGKADFFYWKNEPGNSVKRAFDRFAKSALVDGENPEITRRLLEGTNFAFETPDQSRTFSDNNVISIILPIVIAILFIIALFGGAQYLLQAVVDEKENRTIEIVVTSVTPMQLMSGKILGLAAVSWTQIGVWLLGGAVALQFAQSRIEFLQGASIDAGFIVLAVVLSVLQYLMFGAIMAGIGSIVVDVKQGQSLSTPFTMAAMIPMFFFAVILFDPNGILAVILSLFPLTAPLTLLVRYGMTSVPLWQIVASIVLLTLTVIGAFWLAARIFRIGMLRFGQRVNISEIAANIKF
ncbi:MAG: ABC transporter permease [Chloroflexi bacterium]|nr:ABC transporter permease [Chloroflexota bacterium]